MRRLRKGIYVVRERSAILRGKAAISTEAVQGMPHKEKAEARRILETGKKKVGNMRNQMAEFEYSPGEAPNTTAPSSQPSTGSVTGGADGSVASPPNVKETSPLQRILHKIVDELAASEEFKTAIREEIAALEN